MQTLAQARAMAATSDDSAGGNTMRARGGGSIVGYGRPVGESEQGMESSECTEGPCLCRRDRRGRTSVFRVHLQRELAGGRRSVPIDDRASGRRKLRVRDEKSGVLVG